MGDFNGDGFADLAVGAPERNVNHVKDDGAVLVLYGSSGGLSTTGGQVWNRFTGVPGASIPATRSHGR